MRNLSSQIAATLEGFMTLTPRDSRNLVAYDPFMVEMQRSSAIGKFAW